MVWISRKDLLSPIGLFTLAGFMAFGSNIPFINADSYFGFGISEKTLTKVLVLFLVAYSAFILGTVSRVNRIFPFKRLIGSDHGSLSASIPIYGLLLGMVLVAGFIRAKYHLGEAGIQPAIRYAGYFQYLLYDGLLVFCGWFLASSIRRGTVFILLALSLLVSLAIVQAYLGWRGGIFQVFILAVGIFWYQSSNSRTVSSASMNWVLILVVLAGTITNLGNQVRSERLGGQRTYAENRVEFAEKVVVRTQGTSRLAAVVNHFGDLTWVNNYKIVELYKSGTTSTVYVDRAIHGVGKNQSHSVGASGPGGPYVALGMLGIFGAYYFLGVFYRGCYETILASRNKVFATVLYSYLMYVLFQLLSGNFGLNSVKKIGAVLALTVVLKLIVSRLGVSDAPQSLRLFRKP